MNGLPIVFGGATLLAVASLRNRGSRTRVRAPVYLDLTEENFTYTPAEITAISKTPLNPNDDFRHYEAAVTGRVIINGVSHHIQALRMWEGTELSSIGTNDGGELNLPKRLKLFFPDVPERLRKMVTQPSISENKLSKEELAWLKMARNTLQVAVRDPYERLEDEFYAAYGQPEAFATVEIPGLPGRWAILMYPFAY